MKGKSHNVLNLNAKPTHEKLPSSLPESTREFSSQFWTFSERKVTWQFRAKLPGYFTIFSRWTFSQPKIWVDLSSLLKTLSKNHKVIGNRSNVRSIVRLIVRSFACSFTCLFVHKPFQKIGRVETIDSLQKSSKFEPSS